jgi:hypothetical protein
MKRQGKTSVWEFVEERVCKVCGSKIIVARPEWFTLYEFHEKEWLELPEIP